MPDTSGNRKYHSAHGATRLITAAEFLTETACERQAGRTGITLPARFWNLPEWRKPFHAQVIQANALLKLYDEEVVIGALNENPRVYSLGAPFFAEICYRKQEIVNATRKRLEEAAIIPETSTVLPPRQGIKKGTSARDLLGE